MEIVAFNDEHAPAWDDLVEQAPMGTFLHTRRFLSYHGDRLRDASLVLTDGARLRAVLPAALDPGDPSRVVSHPGATYGGLVHDGRLNGERALGALRDVCAHYAERGLTALRYKPVPHIYQRSPSGDDVWALYELGAARVSCLLGCAIDLTARREPSSRRARSLATAGRSGLELSEDATHLAAYWSLLEERLVERFGAAPVHRLDEIEELRGRFPRAIRPVVALLDGEVVAGTVLFATATVVKTQYLAASEAGARVSALDAVIERCIESARDGGARWFDFGTSAGEGGRGLSDGLYRYKAEFGGGGFPNEAYELPTMRRNSS